MAPSPYIRKGQHASDWSHSQNRSKLIAVANRVALGLGDKTKTFNFEDTELVEVWFHEITCHAGRNTNGKPDTHGDKDVDSYASDIEAMFPKAATTSKVFVEMQGFLK